MHLGDQQHESYSMPQFSPLYPRGPYRYPSVTALLVRYEMDADRFRDLLPDPLAGRGDPVCLIAVYEYEPVNGFGAYNELMIGLAAAHDGDPVTYTPYYLLDGDAPIAAGREIWGIPKKAGTVELDTDGSVCVARAARGGVDLAVVTAEPVEFTEDHPLRASVVRNVHWKRIPAATKGEPPVVNRLVESQTRDIAVEWAQRGPADVEFSASAADPLSIFEPVDTPVGYLVEASWTLDSTDDAVVHRFTEADSHR